MQYFTKVQELSTTKSISKWLLNAHDKSLKHSFQRRRYRGIFFLNNAYIRQGAVSVLLLTGMVA